jgi:hypothetical protein
MDRENIMLTRLLAACAVVALSAWGSLAADFNSGNDYYAPPSSAPGAAGVFGDIHASATYFGGDADDVALGFGGSVVVPFGNNFNAAIKADADYLFDAHDWIAGTSAHVFYANDVFAAGLFGVLTTEDTFGGGAEAAVFVNNVDVIGRVGYFDSSPDFWAADGAVNLYFDPNTAMTAGLGGVWFDSGSDGWTADMGLEHRFNNTPVSAFADLGWTNAEGGDVYAITGGARYVFGDAGPTLQDFNRRNPF